MALSQHMVDMIRGPRALWLAGLGSFILLAAALAFEHIGGLALANYASPSACLIMVLSPLP